MSLHTENSQPSIGVYPGTFDPITNGHIDIIERALALFDTVIVAIAVNGQKQPLFSGEERKEMIEKCFEKEKGRIIVKIVPSGLLVNFAVEQGARAIIRGLRAVSDFDYEFQLALMNRKLVREVESIFLMTAFRWIYISSSLIKDVSKNGGDISDLVPKHVERLLEEKYRP
ncbi:pantetheine-phosphate adenylyltransferase [Desulfotalea psychrophila]|uniref:Phosphopantetheine adenylyltransferase n=1 Tax=Desulfotalea psychrophila (strain LSv54 / DSM 12343) TaxID=177439 RepID=COAD_DESPS|nr:pantetheine-phosphate adenylyltransferase [Desulfotalea psychrophila]Q6AJH7.1 RecName: Full=Phosphopantetheine adenylyltransferase; AltName: Full=Dephospho-CoA pyrophosphorylase; AltName: Full=Pantetheine-phosphate adenylyltransferase; Short=PPAT [Desulfotalea psychrophila LSv54]CAG37503.1 probable phosphopantetheine adenylyltransferase [Desulfotalea psychrophila LSv54]